MKRGPQLKTKPAKPPAHAASRKKTILLADDEPGVREMLGRVLMGEGYSVRVAANGEEALSIAAAARIDLVLLDLNMPIKGGWDTFERLTADNPLLPVIIITARPNQLFTAAGSGAGALLEKPLDFPHLFQVMRSLLDEPAEKRLARMAGLTSTFQYLPAHP